jgi:hypothetical protein
MKFGAVDEIRCRRVVVIVVVIVAAHVSSGNFWQLRGHDDDLLRMELLKLRAESCKRGQTKR